MGKHYRNFTNFVDASLKYLKLKNYDIEIAAMCWMQGECDAFLEENGIAYEQNLQDFIGSIRHRYRKYAADEGIAFIDATIANNPMFYPSDEVVANTEVFITLPEDTMKLQKDLWIQLKCLRDRPDWWPFPN